MPIIQYVLPSKNKQIKRILHLYWEVCPKLDDSGKLKQEMILVWYVGNKSLTTLPLLTLILRNSNAIRNDLQHPNEYIRGATLRFLQKIREAELLEPLVPTVRSCLVSSAIRKSDGSTRC